MKKIHDENRTIHVAHSPDSDDAFMFYALAKDKFPTEGFQFLHHLKDIESLNQEALQGRYEVSAISFHAYAYIHDRYVLLPSGASIGNGYGPILVAKKKISREELRGKRIAIPGKWTTANLVLRLYQRQFEEVIVPFDQILEEVSRGSVDAGLIIHEGQLTYAKEGLEKVQDLGLWWKEEYQLPLPLGGNVIRKDLGKETMERVGYWIKKSILYSLDHRPEALEYAGRFARDLEKEEIDRFVGMYVNHYTLEYDRESKEAVDLLMKEGNRRGIIPTLVTPEYIDIPESL